MSSSNGAPILYSSFDASRLAVAGLDRNKMGGKFVRLTYAKSPKIIVQSPVMKAPFGISEYKASDGSVESMSLELAFQGYDQPGSAAAIFVEKCREIDAWLLSTAVANATEWFGKSMASGVLAEFTRSLVSHRNTQYPPQLRAKIGMQNGKPSVHVFDENRQPVTPEYLVRGSMVRALLELTPVWFIASKQFGVSFRVLQVAIISRPARLENFAFADDDAEPASDGAMAFADDGAA